MIHYSVYNLYSSIIRRLITLLAQQAQMVAQAEASQKQAHSASEAAKKLMEEKDNLQNLVNMTVLFITHSKVCLY